MTASPVSKLTSTAALSCSDWTSTDWKNPSGSAAGFSRLKSLWASLSADFTWLRVGRRSRGKTMKYVSRQ